MIYRTRFIVRPEDLNANDTLYGGKIMSWIDEQAAIYAMCQLGTKNIVTKAVSIDFVSPGYQKDIIEIGVQATKIGRTSITLHVIVRNKDTEQVICDIDNMVFISVGPDGRPTPHGKVLEKTEIETETIKVDNFNYVISTGKAINESIDGDLCVCLNIIKRNNLPENVGLIKPFIIRWHSNNNCPYCRKIVTSDNPNLNKLLSKSGK